MLGFLCVHWASSRISTRKLSILIGGFQRRSCQETRIFNERVVKKQGISTEELSMFSTELQRRSCQNVQFQRVSCQEGYEKSTSSVPFSTSVVGISMTGVVFQRPELSTDNFSFNKNKAKDGSRTRDLLITSELLYH